MSTTESITSISLTLDADVFEMLKRQAEAQKQDPDQYAVALFSDSVRRKEERRKRGYEEGQALLHGPARPLDPEAVYREYREKYNLPDLSAYTLEEIQDQADQILAEMDPETRAELEREGLI